MLRSCLYQPAPSAHSKFLLTPDFYLIRAWFDSFGLLHHQLFSTPVSIAASFLCFVVWCPKRTWAASYLWEPSDAAGQWLVFGSVATWSGVLVSVTCGVESHGLHRFSSLTELNAIYFRRRPGRDRYFDTLSKWEFKVMIHSRAWFLGFSCIRITEGLIKTRMLGPTPRISDSVDLGWVPRICLSNYFPSDGAAGTGLKLLRIIVRVYKTLIDRLNLFLNVL